MAHYLDIPSSAAGSCNKGLKAAIVYIGKRHGRLKFKEGRKTNKYFISGRNYIAGKFGALRKTAIQRMVYPENLKDPEDPKAKVWYYHKKLYWKAYRYIIRFLLLRCPLEDKEYVFTLLNELYQEVRENTKKGDELERMCSNALIYWQKSMLRTYQTNGYVSNYKREEAGILLNKIIRVDKPLPCSTKR